MQLHELISIFNVFCVFDAARIGALEERENPYINSILAIGPAASVRHQCFQFRALAFCWGTTINNWVPEGLIAKLCLLQLCSL